MQVLQQEISLNLCVFRNILSLLSPFVTRETPINTGGLTKVTKVTLNFKTSRTRAGTPGSRNQEYTFKIEVQFLEVENR